MNNSLKKTLLEYGMSEKEADIYLAVLADDGITIKRLAEKTDVNRTTLYPITENLIKKGVIAQFKGKRGVRFIASNPDSLLQKITNLKKSFEESMPQFESLKNQSKKSPQVSYYKGKEGYLSILADTLTYSSKEVLYFGSAQKLNDIVTEKYIEQIYIPIRIKKQIFFKQLVLDDVFSKKLSLTDRKELRSTKFLSGEYNFSANMVIYGNKVAYFTSKKELICVLIESEEISEIERNKFDMLWNNIKNKP